MEISNILTADVLDIIFEGRNKEYGAYELRRSYRKRLLMSVSVMFLFMGLLYGGMVLAGKASDDKSVASLVVRDTQLEEFKQPEKEPELPPPAKQEPPKMEMKKLVDQFRIVPDNVPTDVIPPVDELEHVKIGNMDQRGLEDDGLTAPPATDGVGKGVIVEPTRTEDNSDSLFLKVELESSYPGGPSAWKRYLERNLRYPQDAIDQGIEGRMTVKFIVDREGNVSDVEVVEGPKELQAEAIRVIKKSGQWTPAVQNGRKVKSYKHQPIIFQLPQE